jgi:UDP-N-acetylglucosamine--N-acetylmuramyl-(pentapeptide) pyrophosphoryl-undecaprenol N-acetylglucosamine transferase
MARGRPVSVVFYAINGRGLGHLTRLLAIARAARTLLEAADVPADLEIVTTSEASFIADDFPVYKLPSKTAVARAGAARDRYVQRAKLIVSNLVAAQSPDLLVLDTVPYGAFQEFSFLRSYARATAYVYRHLDARSAASDLVQRHLELFDRILIPDDEARAEGYPVPRGARRRVAFTGPVTGYEQAEAWDRARVRGYFGVEEGRRLVYVAAGGGGDGRDALEALVRAVAGDERNVVLAGYGPLHRGGCVYAKNVIPLLEGNVSRIFGGVDAAVSAAGFNSYEELLAARVPTLFFAQDKGLDRQDLRIERGLAGSLHGVIPERADPELVRGRLDDLLEGELGARVREALSARPAPDGALRAAVELLGVCAGLEGSSLDRGVLHELAALRRDAPRGLPVAFSRAARAYRSFRALAGSAAEVAVSREAHAASWWSGAPRGKEALRAGAALAALRERSQLDEAGWRALTSAFARGPERGYEAKLERLLEVAAGLEGDLAPMVSGSDGAELRARLLAALGQHDGDDGRGAHDEAAEGGPAN